MTQVATNTTTAFADSIQLFCDESYQGSFFRGLEYLKAVPHSLTLNPIVLGKKLLGVPAKVFYLALSIPSYTWSAATALPRYAYSVLTGSESEKTRICRQVLQNGTKSFEDVDPLGFNSFDQSIGNQSAIISEVLMKGGIPAENRDYIHFRNALHRLVETNNLELLESFLKGRPVNINARDSLGMSALHLAALFQRPEMIRELVAHHAEIGSVDRLGRTPAMIAAKTCYDCLKLLVENKAHLNSRDDDCAGIWHYAVFNPHSDWTMKMLYQKNIPVDAKDKNGQTPLHYACREGKANAVNNLIYYGLKEVQRDNKGLLPVHYAAQNDHADVIHRLAAHRVNLDTLAPNPKAGIHFLDVKGQYDYTPLMFAANGGHSEAASALIYNGANLNEKNHQRETALNLAVENNAVGVVQSLLNTKKVDVNNIPESGMSPLYVALKRGYSDVAELLLEHGGVVQAGFDDTTKLNEAVATGDYNYVQKLLLSGVLLNSRDYEHQTPLMIASARGDSKMVTSLLAAAGKNYQDLLSVLDLQNRQAIHFSALSGNSSVTLELIRKGSNYQAVDSTGKLPLHYAVEAGNLENIRLLAQQRYTLKMGIDTPDHDGDTPLLKAVKSGSNQVAQLLIEMGASPLILDKEGKSSIHLAATQGNLELLTYLLEKKSGGLAGVNWADKYGHTPLYYAAKNEHNTIVDFLIKCGGKIYFSGYDALQSAVIQSNEAEVSKLLSENFPVVRTSIGDTTALHLSAQQGTSRITQAIINANPTLINYTDIEGNTPLLAAAMNNHIDDLITFVNLGADVDAKSSEGKTALHYAAAHGSDKAVYALALAGANLEAPTKNGLTPLTVAAAKGHDSTCQLLVDLGVNPNKILNRNTEIKSYALLNSIGSNNFEKVQKLLLEGARLDVSDEDGWTALHFAALPDVSIEILKSLLAIGLPVNLAGENNMTPLHVAAATGNVEAFKLILENNQEVYKKNKLLIDKIIEDTNNSELKDFLKKHKY